ncbi:MAG: C39 family peptidase [Myxococcota bacterium]
MPKRIADLIGSAPYDRLRREAEEKARRAGDHPSFDSEPALRAGEGRTLDVEPQRQVGNGCGTTALAMALTYVLGRRVTQADIDADVRLLDVFSSASNLRDAARRHGVQARLQNNLSAREVVEYIDHGRPIVFLADLTPEDSADVATMHYRVIDGYRWHAGQLELRIADPWDVPRYWRSWDTLQPQWANIKGLGTELGYNRFGIVLGASAGDTDLPVQRLSGVHVTEAAADSVLDVLNDGARIGQGRWLSALAIVADVFRAVLALIAFPFRKLFDRGIDRSDGKNVASPTAAPPTPAVARQARWAQPTDRELVARTSIQAVEPAPHHGGLPPPQRTTSTSSHS